MASPHHSPIERDALPAIDARICELVRGAARRRLALGEALERLGRVGGPAALGFSSLGAYTIERCGYSGRWAEEARGLVRRLAGLPLLRAALDRGAVTWSMAQLLARHASAETEAELVAAAASTTVRAMRARLEPGRVEAPEPPPRRTIEAVIPVEDAWAFERARMVVGAVTAERSIDIVVEAMLAETLTSTLPPREVDLADALARAVDLSQWRAEGQALDARVRDRMEAAFEPALSPRPAPSDDARTCGAEVPDLPTLDDAGDAGALDRVIVRLAGEVRERDLAIGRLAIVLVAIDGVRGLGYQSVSHWARERLGMSRSALMAKMALARRCEALPALGEALRGGRIGTASAALIWRIADADTAARWVERAAARTFVHLREEVEAAGLLARVSGDRAWLEPPDDETLAAVHEAERAALALEAAPETPLEAVETEVRMCVASEGDEAPSRSAAGLSCLGTVRWRVTLAADLADLWMAVQRLHGTRGDPRSFVRALSDNILRYWAPTDEGRPFEAVYRRDRYRCQSPTCDRREVGAHHIVFRAHGGGDEPGNCVALCGRCHVGGVHAGRIRVEGTAPDALRWTFAESLVVERRMRRAA